jgi:hypothetical protein
VSLQVLSSGVIQSMNVNLMFVGIGSSRQYKSDFNSFEMTRLIHFQDRVVSSVKLVRLTSLLFNQAFSIIHKSGLQALFLTAISQ